MSVRKIEGYCFGSANEAYGAFENSEYKINTTRQIVLRRGDGLTESPLGHLVDDGIVVLSDDETNKEGVEKLKKFLDNLEDSCDGR